MSYCLQFNGTQGSYGEVTGVNVDTSPGALHTVEFWLFVPSSGNKSGMPFGWDTNYDLWLTNNNFGFNTGQGDVNGIDYTPYYDQWVHVTATFTNGFPKNSNVLLYLNGNLQNISLRQGSPTITKIVTPNFWFAGWGASNGYKLSYSISRLRIWKGTLSRTQLMQCMLGTPTDKTNLLGQWNLDEGTGTTVIDTSGQGHNGTIYGALYLPFDNIPGRITSQEMSATENAVFGKIGNTTQLATNAKADLVSAVNETKAWCQ